jgi:ABC-2 type transport system permease protein
MTVLIREVYALTRRWLVMLKRDRLYLVFSVAQPAVWLVFFGAAVGNTVDPQVIGEQSYLRFTLPGVVAFTVIGNGVAGAMPLLWDKETGYLDKLLSMPIARASILLSRIVSQLGVGAAQVTVILLVAATMGALADGSAPSILLIFLVSGLLTVAVTSASLALAYSVRGHETFFAVSGFVTMPLMFLSTAFVPASALDPWLAHIAELNPVSHAVQAMRGALDGDAAAAITGTTVSAGFAAGCLALAVARYRHRTAERCAS